MLITKTITKALNRHPLQLGLNKVTIYKFIGITFRKDIETTVYDNSMLEKYCNNTSKSNQPKKSEL